MQALYAVRPNGIRHSFFLRRNTSDLYTMVQIFIKQQYNIKLPFTPATIIDAGSNIGLASVYFKNLYPDAHIITIEPDNDNFQLLQKNLSHYSNMSYLQGGIWFKNASLKVSDKNQHGKWGLVVEETAPGTKDAITAYTIQDVLQQKSWKTLDLLKLDIEGSEKEVFEQGNCDWMKKTRAMIVELHDRTKDGTASAFFNAIVKNISNYSVELMGDNIIVINHDIK
jgi:FkbM family methyltransferase